jgi:hypothetical protein
VGRCRKETLCREHHHDQHGGEDCEQIAVRRDGHAHGRDRPDAGRRRQPRTVPPSSKIMPPSRAPHELSFQADDESEQARQQDLAKQL